MMCFVDQRLRKESTLYGRVVLGDPIAFPRIISLSHLAKMISNGMVDTMLVPEKQPDLKRVKQKSLILCFFKLVNCFGKNHCDPKFSGLDKLISSLQEPCVCPGFSMLADQVLESFGFLRAEV